MLSHERQAELGLWLAAREADQEDAKAIPRGRKERAYATMLGWMPLAVLIFWTTIILARLITFHDESDPEIYRLSAFGTKEALTAEVIEDSSHGAHVQLTMPDGVNLVRIDDVASDKACSASANPHYAHSGRTWRAELTPQTPNVVEGVLYPGHVQVTRATCGLNWHPQHESFASYRVQVKNEDGGALNASNAANTAGRLPVNVIAPSITNARQLPADESVITAWKRGAAEQDRDVYLIVIGALIALGGALVVEALRGEIEIAIEASRPGEGPL